MTRPSVAGLGAVFLSCDDCGQGPPEFRNHAVMRHWAHLNGWRLGPGLAAVCAECAGADFPSGLARLAEALDWLERSGLADEADGDAIRQLRGCVVAAYDGYAKGHLAGGRADLPLPPEPKNKRANPSPRPV